MLLTGKSVITSQAQAKAGTGHFRRPKTATLLTPYTSTRAGASSQDQPVMISMFGGEYSADRRAGQNRRRSHSIETPSMVR